MATIAEEYLAEGEARGKAEGRVEERVANLVELSTAKFGPLPGWIVQSIRDAAPEQLRLWLHRILTADSLDTVFAPQ